MTGLITKSRGLILAGALGLSVLALAACGGGDSTNAADNTNGQGTASGLANLLNSTSGAAAYEQLLRGTGGSGSNTGIWVSGQGEANAIPDLALLNLGAEAFADTVAGARTDSSEAMGHVLQVLEAQGVAERDIQTRHFNINPRYTSHQVTRCFAAGLTIEPEPRSESLMEEEAISQVMAVPPSLESEPVTSGSTGVMVPKADNQARGEECVTERETVLLGYEVSNQLSVKIRDLGSIGEVIDAVTDAGGNFIRFQGVSFTTEDDQELKDRARAAAVEDLMDKANQTALIAGVELGELVYINESGGSVISDSFRSGGIAFAQSAALTSIQVGELQVRVNLQAAFEIDSKVNQ